MKLSRKITAIGLTASLLTGQAGTLCALAETAETPKTDAAEVGNNVLLITVDQEHYFSEYPEGTSWKARQLLAELGTTFEKHYACSNMSTSSRSVMFRRQGDVSFADKGTYLLSCKQDKRYVPLSSSPCLPLVFNAGCIPRFPDMLNRWW